MIKKPQTKTPTKTIKFEQQNKQFSTKNDTPKRVLDHIHELKLRFVWIACALLAGSVLGYALHKTLVELIQKPLDQPLYFNSPVGGLNFIIKLCLTFAVIVSLPILLYQVAKFFHPLLEEAHKKALIPYAFCSLLLAYAGVVFAYIVSLPNALVFLSHFGGESIVALITVDEYYNFVLAYLLGFALLFQLPIIVLFINRLKPLKPSKMMKAQRYIILGSFIIAAILTPTPDPINQAMMAMPAIVLYQVAVIIVWRKNRKRTYAEDLYELTVSPELVTESVVTEQEPAESRDVLAEVNATLDDFGDRVAKNMRKRESYIQDVITRRSTPLKPTERAQPTGRYVLQSSRLVDIVV